MPVTDPIADMLVVLKNGNVAHKETIEIKRSKMNESMLEILKKEGFVSNYKPIEDNKQGVLKVYLRYDKDNNSALSGLRRVSKPGRRVYVRADEIKSVYGGLGVSLISTSHGIMTDKEAREKKLGGEILCSIW